MAQKILIVEDDVYTKELYQEILKDKGFETVGASDGEAGLSEALKGGFDLILLDIMMPKKDGITFLKEYQAAKPTQPNGKIVVLSNVGEDTIIKTCLELGAAGYLIKSSLTPDEILKEIKNYL